MASDEIPPDVRPAEDAISPALLDRFTRALIGIARRQLDARLHHKIEPEDVVQSAYKSFFLRYGEGALGDRGWQSLWGLLTCITLRKCADRVRYYQAECRDLSRERAQLPAAEGPEPWREAVSREPTPQQAAALAETVEQVLRGVNADERSIIELSLQGYTTQEISEQLGRAERSVRRLRERVRKHLQRLQAGDGC
jgi:RNA polymerase sigma-70 factor (ECF subfamily)